MFIGMWAFITALFGYKNLFYYYKDPSVRQVTQHGQQRPAGGLDEYNPFADGGNTTTTQVNHFLLAIYITHHNQACLFLISQQLKKIMREGNLFFFIEF